MPRSQYKHPDANVPGAFSEEERLYGFHIPAHLPGYRSLTLGDWRISRFRGHVGSSYLAETCVEPDYFVLRHRSGDTWMSTCRLEVESHAWHVAQAKGTVFAAGLGMGMFAALAAAKPDVERVIVCEIDMDVIKLVQQAMTPKPVGWDKVEIYKGDVTSDQFMSELKYRLGGARPDYLYADIWPTYPHPAAPSDTSRLSGFLKPPSAGWWGQEVSFGVWCYENGRSVSMESLTEYFRICEVDAPLTSGYLAFCDSAVTVALAETRVEASGPNMASV